MIALHRNAKDACINGMKCRVAAGKQNPGASLGLTAKVYDGMDTKSSQASRKFFGINGMPDAR
jgi:hypothetical protein